MLRKIHCILDKNPFSKDNALKIAFFYRAISFLRLEMSKNKVSEKICFIGFMFLYYLLILCLCYCILLHYVTYT